MFTVTPTAPAGANGTLTLTISANAGIADTAGNALNLPYTIQSNLNLDNTITPTATVPITADRGGGGKTTSILAANMITYNSCDISKDIAVRVLTFNSQHVNQIQTILYSPTTTSPAIDVTSQVAPSTYLQDSASSSSSTNYKYTVFDATVPAGTEKFFVTTSDTSDLRITSSVLVDIKNGPSLSCEATIFPHDLKDTGMSLAPKKSSVYYLIQQ